MDDKDLLSAVREDFSGVRMRTGSEAILADGRRRRGRRRMYGVTGVAAVAAVAAISATALTSGSAATGGTHNASLTAWTVQKEANGTIDVTIHDLLSLSGLQQRLTADGVPAEVIPLTGHLASCVTTEAIKNNMAAAVTMGRKVSDGYAFKIHPAGIPSGTKLLVFRNQGNTTVAGARETVSLQLAGYKMWIADAGTKAGVALEYTVFFGFGLVNADCQP